MIAHISHNKVSEAAVTHDSTDMMRASRTAELLHLNVHISRFLMTGIKPVSSSQCDCHDCSYCSTLTSDASSDHISSFHLLHLCFQFIITALQYIHFQIYISRSFFGFKFPVIVCCSVLGYCWFIYSVKNVLSGTLTLELDLNKLILFKSRRFIYYSCINVTTVDYTN